MTRIYILLLRLYPSEYRAFFGDEMAGVFRDASRDRAGESRLSRAKFLLCEILSVLMGAAVTRYDCRPRVRWRWTVLLCLPGALLAARIVSALASLSRIMNAAPAPLAENAAELLFITTVSFVIVIVGTLAFVVNLQMIARRRARCSKFAE